MNWKDVINNTTAEKWELFNSPTSEWVAQELNKKLIALCEEGFERMKKDGLSNVSAALQVREKFTAFRASYSDFGALDTEPDWKAADLIDGTFGTDNGRG